MKSQQRHLGNGLNHDAGKWYRSAMKLHDSLRSFCIRKEIIIMLIRNKFPQNDSEVLFIIMRLDCYSYYNCRIVKCSFRRKFTLCILHTKYEQYNTIKTRSLTTIGSMYTFVTLVRNFCLCVSLVSFPSRKHDPWCLLLNNGNHRRILIAFFFSVAKRLQWHFSVISHFWQTYKKSAVQKMSANEWMIYSQTTRIGWLKENRVLICFIHWTSGLCEQMRTLNVTRIIVHCIRQMMFP